MLSRLLKLLLMLPPVSTNRSAHALMYARCCAYRYNPWVYPQPPNLAGVARRMVDSTTATDQSSTCRRQSPTASQSTFGPPVGAVAVARIVLRPAARPTLRSSVCQPAPPPVGGKLSAVTTAPLTAISSGRSSDPFAENRNVSRCWPGRGASTVHSMYPPTASS